MYGIKAMPYLKANGEWRVKLLLKSHIVYLMSEEAFYLVREVGEKAEEVVVREAGNEQRTVNDI